MLTYMCIYTCVHHTHAQVFIFKIKKKEKFSLDNKGLTDFFVFKDVLISMCLFGH